MAELTKAGAELEREISELQQEAQSRNNEMNREMRRKERAERELKQLKGQQITDFQFYTFYQTSQ